MRTLLPVLGILLITFPLPIVHAQPQFNWVLATVSLPAGQYNFTVVMRESGTSQPGSAVVGFFSRDNAGIDGGAWEYGDSGSFVHWNAAPGGSGNVTLSPVSTSRGGTGAEWFYINWPVPVPTTAFFLIADSNLAGSSLYAAANNSQGQPLSTQVTSGDGAFDLSVGNPDAGVGVVAGGGSAFPDATHSFAAGSYHRVVPNGLVGAWTFACNPACNQKWESPDGRSGAFNQARTPTTGYGLGSIGFAGPAGSWNWSYVGAQAGEKAALIVPIGTFSSEFGG